MNEAKSFVTMKDVSENTSVYLDEKYQIGALTEKCLLIIKEKDMKTNDFHNKILKNKN